MAVDPSDYIYLDLGDGNVAEIRGDYGLAWHHKRPDNGEDCTALGWVHWHGPNGWTLVSREPLTLSPSLLCTVCGAHGFIRDGRWLPV